MLLASVHEGFKNLDYLAVRCFLRFDLASVRLVGVAGSMSCLFA